MIRTPLASPGTRSFISILDFFFAVFECFDRVWGLDFSFWPFCGFFLRSELWFDLFCGIFFFGCFFFCLIGWPGMWFLILIFYFNFLSCCWFCLRSRSEFLSMLGFVLGSSWLEWLWAGYLRSVGFLLWYLGFPQCWSWFLEFFRSENCWVSDHYSRFSETRFLLRFEVWMKDDWIGRWLEISVKNYMIFIWKWVKLWLGWFCLEALEIHLWKFMLICWWSRSEVLELICVN